MSSRARILAKVRSALSDVPNLTPDVDVPQPWVYGQPTELADVLSQFVQRCADYRAEVIRTPRAEVADQVAKALGELGAVDVVLPAGLDPAWRAAIAQAGIAIHDDQPPLSRAQLNAIAAVVTAARVGVAETGTVVLDHAADQGRRALTLVPDRHICVVDADQVVSDVPEAVVRLEASIAAGHPLTWVSGPSATSDIELSRVEGVHGPRQLVVILAE
jgi:L-lactate dehydrogenase complex protein LldG